MSLRTTQIRTILVLVVKQQLVYVSGTHSHTLQSSCSLTVFVVGGFRILGLYIHVGQYLTVHPFQRFKLWISKETTCKVMHLKKHHRVPGGDIMTTCIKHFSSNWYRKKKWWDAQNQKFRQVLAKNQKSIEQSINTTCMFLRIFFRCQFKPRSLNQILIIINTDREIISAVGLGPSGKTKGRQFSV